MNEFGSRISLEGNDLHNGGIVPDDRLDQQVFFLGNGDVLRLGREGLAEEVELSRSRKFVEKRSGPVQLGIAEQLHILAVVVFLFQQPFLFVHQLSIKGEGRPGDIVSEGVVVEGKGTTEGKGRVVRVRVHFVKDLVSLGENNEVWAFGGFLISKNSEMR